MQILLLSTNYDRGRFRPGESLGVKYIASSLQSAGYSVDVFDIELDNLTVDSLIEQLSSSQLDLVGIGVPFTAAIPSAIEFARELRDKIPIRHLTIGGQGIAFLWEEVLKDRSFIDTCVVFEGELTIVDLVRAIESGSHCGSVRGIYYREKGVISFTGYRDPITNLDDISFPLRKSHSAVLGEPHFLLLTSRGCTRNCTFCQSGNFGNRYHNAPKWRYRSAENVISEIEQLVQNYGARTFSFIDDAFLGGGIETGPNRARLIAEVLARDYPQVKWSMECRADEVTDSLIGDLFDGGLRHVFVGIDSGNEEDLKLFGKQSSLAKIEEAITILRNHNLSLEFGFIMFHPDSTLETLSANLEFFKRNKIATASMLTNKLALYPGSGLVRRFVRSNLMAQKGFLFSYRFRSAVVSRLYDIAKKNLSRLSAIEAKLARLTYLRQTSPSESSSTNAATLAGLTDRLISSELDVFEYLVGVFHNRSSSFSRDHRMILEIETETCQRVAAIEKSLSSHFGENELDNGARV